MNGGAGSLPASGVERTPEATRRSARSRLARFGVLIALGAATGVDPILYVGLGGTTVGGVMIVIGAIMWLMSLAIE